MHKIYTITDLDILQNKKLKVGILGGSFNPAHNGHLQITLDALNIFDLDYVIWLVALQNPSKTFYEKNIFTRAIEAATLAQNPKILISTAEYDLNIRYSYQIIKHLTDCFKQTEFFWIMGADCLKHFHLWEYSYLISKLCKIIVFDRPGYSSLLKNNEFSSRFGQVENMILHKGPMINISSTKIRNKHDKKS